VAPESKEGSCHTLRVKVDRKGTSVRARSNYCTEKPLDLLAGTSAGKELENRAAGAEAGGIAASIELPYFYLSPNVARVNLAMEIAADALKFQNQKGKLHAEMDLLGIASTPDGSVGARFSDAVKFDFGTQAEIEKLKGKSSPLREGVQNRSRPVSLYDGIQLRRPEFWKAGSAAGRGTAEKAGELDLSSLVLGKEAHPAADLGLSTGVSIGDQTPLVAQGMQVIPAGSSQFLKSEQAFFYFEVYDANPASVTAQVRILDRSGAPKWDSGPQKLSVPQQGGTLPLSSLARDRINSK
jgi:hypothetical protein